MDRPSSSRERTKREQDSPRATVARQILLLGLCLLVPGIVLQVTHRVWSYGITERSAYVLLMAGRAALLTLEVALLLKLFQLVVLRGTWSETWKKLTVTALTLASLVVLLEIVFTFVPHSSGNSNTLAAHNWYVYYWRVNSLGYRDVEWDLDALKHKRRIVVLGDSIVAGQGIEDPANRFSDLLAARLPEDYVVLNLGRNGSDTLDEYRRLVELPLEPDVLVLTHYDNDTEYLVERRGDAFDVRPGAVAPGAGWDWPRLGDWLVERSYLVNFCYWKIKAHLLAVAQRRMIPAGIGADEMTSLTVDFFRSNRDSDMSVFLNEEPLEAHLANLQRFVELARTEGYALVVILFPKLRRPDISRDYMHPRLVSFFRSEGVPVVEPADVLMRIAPAARVVNRDDVHPSEVSHRAVAGLLYETLRQRGLIPAVSDER